MLFTRCIKITVRHACSVNHWVISFPILVLACVESHAANFSPDFIHSQHHVKSIMWALVLQRTVMWTWRLSPTVRRTRPTTACRRTTRRTRRRGSSARQRPSRTRRRRSRRRTRRHCRPLQPPLEAATITTTNPDSAPSCSWLSPACQQLVSWTISKK